MQAHVFLGHGVVSSYTVSNLVRFLRHSVLTINSKSHIVDPKVWKLYRVEPSVLSILLPLAAIFLIELCWNSISSLSSWRC